MAKRILRTGNEARESLIKGAKTLASAVRLTLGPFAMSAALEKGDEVIDDGAVIAKEIAAGCIDDEIESQGARKIEKVSSKTDEVAGDGTTTSILLAEGIIESASLYLGNSQSTSAKKRPAEMLQLIEEEQEEVITALKDMATKVKSKEELIEVATVSASNAFLGKMIGEMQYELGPEGRIIAREVLERECSIERVRGVEWDNGFGTRLIMNNPAKESLEMDDTGVLLTDHVLTDFAPIHNLLQKFWDAGGRRLVVMGRAFGELAIKRCMKDIENGFWIIPVNCPYVNMKEVMKDLEALTGARYISTESAFIENATLKDIGRTGRIEAYAYRAIMTAPNPGPEDNQTKEAIKERVEARAVILGKELEGNISDFQREEISRRLAQLRNGFAIAKIGADNPERMHYLKRKADDAVSATRSALQEGVVPGGGLAFKAISEKMKPDSILKAPLMAVYNQIMASAPAGFKIEPWVRDSVKVLRVALQQACAVASIFATTGIAIATERPKPIDTLIHRATTTPQE